MIYHPEAYILGVIAAEDEMIRRWWNETYA